MATKSQKTQKPSPPKKIKIGPHVIKVKLTTAKELTKLASVGTNPRDAMGLTDVNISSIFVDNSLSTSIEADTLLHEVLHHVFYLGGGREHFEDEDEERIVCALSTLLYGVIKENPKLIEYLVNS